MITGAFLYLGLAILSLFVAVLPASEGLPSGFETGLQSLFDYAWKFNDFVAVDTLLTVLGLVIAFEAGLMLYRLARWFFASVPLSPIKHK